ncbi:hypothetical protein [Flammeovirga kamogawensis]|uniref:Uncharacterized protein n=1 Tax=Flammeovirga kamogawensis TaxID=373891 RepID=A0ABX8H2S2_9BACT|nr:hypothetical protein [Flammeovirga kamogawensis]MBB6463796.1 hypothetical protein [Flammeovirga kamogawensis]QWG09696.1 hypothetical protein KM029_24155 [Flammeovirga kamogawensis]
MEDFATFDMNDQLLLNIDSETMDDDNNFDQNEWETQLDSLEKYELDIDEEI